MICLSTCRTLFNSYDTIHRSSQDFLCGGALYSPPPKKKSDDIFSHHPLTCHMHVILTISTTLNPPCHLRCTVHLTKFSPLQQNCLEFFCRPGGAPPAHFDILTAFLRHHIQELYTFKCMYVSYWATLYIYEFNNVFHL